MARHPRLHAPDPLQRIQNVTTSTGTTDSTLYNDGTLKTFTSPGHAPLLITAVNPVTEDPTQTTRSDTGVVRTPENSLGETQSQSGAGMISARHLPSKAPTTGPYPGCLDDHATGDFWPYNSTPPGSPDVSAATGIA